MMVQHAGFALVHHLLVNSLLLLLLLLLLLQNRLREAKRVQKTPKKTCDTIGYFLAIDNNNNNNQSINQSINQ